MLRSDIVKNAYSKLRRRPLPPACPAGGQLYFAWREGAFPGRKGSGGAVTLNNVVYKPEIGLSGTVHQRQPRERRQEEPDEGCILLCQAQEHLPSTAGEGNQGEAQSQPSPRGGAGLQPVAFLRAPGGPWGFLAEAKSLMQKSTIIKV